MSSRKSSAALLLVSLITPSSNSRKSACEGYLSFSLPRKLLTSVGSSPNFRLDVVKLGEGWTRGLPEWKSIAGSQRAQFSAAELLLSEHPGAGLSITFHGTAIGAYVLAGPDAGQLLVRIDGRDWQIVELYHGYSSGLHYPRTVMFACDLKRGPHIVEVKIGDQHHAQSQGHAARILSFVANGGT